MAARFKSISEKDRKTEKSRLNQLIDIIASDVYGVANRRKYPSYVTGLSTPITSSLFQTVYDQDSTYQSSNAMLDISFGLFANITNVGGVDTVTGSAVVTSLNPTIDANGKLIFSSDTSLMMREKINIYKQYAQALLGNANSSFFAPFEDTTPSNRIDEAIFINVKRLFKRDNIYKGSFGMKLFDSLIPFASAPNTTTVQTPSWTKALTGNLFASSTDNTPTMIIDKDGSNNYRISYAGEVGSLWSTTNSGSTYSASPCGLIFYDAGIVVLDTKKIFNLTEQITGVIDFPDTSLTNNVYFINNVSPTLNNIPAGKKALGGSIGGNVVMTLDDLFTLGSIDDIVDHFCMARFPNTTTTAIAFQNETIVNSTIYYCNADIDDFNYSTNPSYTDTTGKIQVVDEVTDIPFSYITTVGLYNSSNELLAVAKLSRPIEKNPLHNLSIRVRLDY